MTLALVALLLFAADTVEVPSAPPDPARQVITRAEIEAAGLYRLPDLFRLIDGVRTQSVDGFTWRTSSAGRPFGAEAWTLLVDGTRIDIAQWGEQNLSLVPVAITHVDSVEVWHGPQFVAGTIAPGGVIHIWTSQPTRGVEARAGVGIGNEVGDPGPFRYVPERASRNVDKFGADYEGLVAWTGSAVRAQARGKLLRFYATDFAAFDRNQAALGGNPALRLFAPALRLEADALGGTHTLSVLGGGANDLWFFQPFGREIPVQRRWGQISAHGDAALSPHLRLGYRAAYVENRLDAWEGAALGLDPRWRERTVRAGLDGLWQRGPLAAGLSGEIQRTTVERAEGFTLATLIGHAARTTARSRSGFDASLAVSEGATAVSAALSTRHAVGRWTIGARAAHTQELPQQAGRFGFWFERGYTSFADDFGLRLQVTGVEQAESPRTSTQQSLDLNATGALGQGLRLDAGIAVRRLGDVYFETQAQAPDPSPTRTYLAPSTLLRTDGESTTATGRLALRFARPRWNGRVFYDGLAVLDGNLDRAREAVPRHRAGATATLVPDPSFSITGTLTYRSASRWPAYEILDGGNDGLYDDDVPSVWLLDASAQKTLWHERLRLSLLFRNLLGQEERYHPIGAALDLRFYLRVEFLLGR